MKKITALIVEDSRLARNELKELLKAHGHIRLLGEAENADEAFQQILKLKPDLLFLDINMPGKDGFELLEMLDEVPEVIFTTAYDEYAIKSFEYNALDYLLKPISAERFARTLDKLSGQLKPAAADAEGGRLRENSRFFIKDGERCWLVRIGDVNRFEIVGNYTRVYFEAERPMLYKSLNQVEDKLPERIFFRANRQEIVNIHAIAEVIPWFNGKLKLRMQDGAEIEVSRRQSSVFRDRMSL